ncbi:hypothetical protein A2V56_02095 [Candidatus Woesebacteria bacterium RBG_19FT_COMBO_42_9]|uniref:Lipopolysaccharide assembly protein A domain-containing protein n=1 Tax=Candidatus Woesebacteria bacterium RBG_16_42_24 TaxID=1802485 RepID=A0A1F7XN38_9BACT|nr:MAG: hypothetical protein A2V97_02785 [Candidatus Woesebacteria bacterium RBG_16_42_24]OGM16470.1 MAG: hypothetical protein A2V56_02095 [Candidatus Woesebacteria bacterium RBG_19FT_COMBO_42_9]OGM66226.1 MAG: hypothetical protein A2985_00100 [Candidatus Woesebacteria bacterium RIFCSPLOWO2_01_FULL_43_11]
MLTLVVTVLFGLGFALFATQNTGHTAINVGPYALAEVPVYLVILASVILTLLVTGFIYLLKSLSTSMTISEKEDELKKTKDELAEITKQAHKLELENTKLKAEAGEEEDENAI